MRITQNALRAASIIVLAHAPDSTAAIKTLRFWNLTAATIGELYLAPAGTSRWSANLCLTDPDHAVDSDERLALPGLVAGTYDVKIVDARKRTCTFRAIPVRGTGPYAFSVSEQQMAACARS